MDDNAAYLKELHQNLIDHFNWSEIEDLCLRLNIDYEIAPGTDKSRWMRGLLYALGQDGRLPELVALAREERPNVEWPPVPHDFQLPASLNPAAIYPQITKEEVAELVNELKHQDQPKVWDGRIPYPGLRAFQESDAEFFFGREELVDDLLKRVEEARFVVIAGPSGSGKSSVARAGLFQALDEGRLEHSDSWLRAAMSPKNNPIENLAQAMANVAMMPAAAQHIRANGLHNPLALHEQAEALLGDDKRRRLVLLVDQFEEVFTQTKDEETRQAFIDLLTTAAQVENGRTIILLSLRSDFVSYCAKYSELRTLMSQQFQLVGAMAPRDLAQAITLPALVVGAEIEPALVKQIIDDMKGEPGALPLMSFALRDLFEAQKSEKAGRWPSRCKNT
jgi:hypothetical protein